MLKATDLQKVTTICKNAGIDYLALFGSYARGDYHENSVVELLVNYIKTPSYFEEARIMFKIEDTIGKKVHFVSEKNIKPDRKPYTDEELVTVYDLRHRNE